MAKIKRGIFKVSGKLDDKVFVDSNTYGSHVRNAPAAGKKKDELAFKATSSLTKFVNRLAAELNSTMKKLYPEFKPGNLYHRLLKIFKKPVEGNRFLLLKRLAGMEVHEDYPMSRLGSCNITVKGRTGSIIINLHTNSHPEPGRYRANGYYYELLLFTWGKGQKPAKTERQLSDWIYLEKETAVRKNKPEFEFKFSRGQHTQHWLLVLRQRLALNEKEIDMKLTEAIQVVDAGSFNKKDLALLEKSMEPVEKAIKKKEEELVRVKAKRI